MLQCLPPSSFWLASAVLIACGSGGSDGAAPAAGGAGSNTQAASGAPAASGGAGAGGQFANGGALSSNAGAGNLPSAGGAMASGGAAAGQHSGGSSTATGGRASGGASAAGGTQSAAGGISGGAGGGAAVPTAKCPDATWKLAWGDNFDGPSGTAVDASNWAYDTGPNWYNGELQAYTPGATNASLDGNGNLVIEARKEAREGRQYTSARLKTEGKKTFTRGRFEGRMKMPFGQGMWPAFWIRPRNTKPEATSATVC